VSKVIDNRHASAGSENAEPSTIFRQANGPLFRDGIEATHDDTAADDPAAPTIVMQ